MEHCSKKKAARFVAGSRRTPFPHTSTLSQYISNHIGEGKGAICTLNRAASRLPNPLCEIMSEIPRLSHSRCIKVSTASNGAASQRARQRIGCGRGVVGSVFGIVQGLIENSLSSERSDLSQMSGIEIVLVIGSVWIKGFAGGVAAMLLFSGVDEILCGDLLAYGTKRIKT